MLKRYPFGGPVTTPEGREMSRKNMAAQIAFRHEQSSAADNQSSDLVAFPAADGGKPSTLVARKGHAALSRASMLDELKKQGLNPRKTHA